MLGNRKGCPYTVFHGEVRFLVSGVIPRVIIRSPLQGVDPLGGCLGQPITVYRLLFTVLPITDYRLPFFPESVFAAHIRQKYGSK